MARKNRKQLTALLVVLVTIGISIGGFGAYKHFNVAPLLPKTITDKASFVIFYPPSKTSDPTAWHLVPSATSYSADAGVLTLLIALPQAKRQVTLKEQSLPGSFTDVPTLYSKMLNSLNEYNELQTEFGSIALTHPKELNGGQTAVVNKSGTLMFAQPSADLTDDQWQVFFNSLRILRS